MKARRREWPCFATGPVYGNSSSVNYIYVSSLLYDNISNLFKVTCSVPFLRQFVVAWVTRPTEAQNLLPTLHTG